MIFIIQHEKGKMTIATIASNTKPHLAVNK